ncbi:Nucleic acid-binding, OB-fold [Sesbania bispinosa]|nr:Nucleic acid-binding, OB-fold [Sesbania bispinosa]
MVNVLLKDNRGITLSVTLRDTYADQLLSFLDNNEAGLIIVILTLAKIRDTKGQYPISIQNSKYGSKLLINEDSEEINQYKSSLESLLICDSLSQGISQVPSYSQTSTGEWFFTNTQVMSLKEINMLDMETYCVTVAKIDKFLVANGWSYDACMYCTKGGDPKETPYLCPGCKKTVSETVARFRLEVQVSQGSEVAKFVLWDDVYELDPMAVPVTIDSILGKTLAFNIKVQPKYKRSSVTKVSEDAVIMESIINKLPVDEAAITINSDKGKSVLNEDDYFDSLCMSATADYDPHSLGNQTPANRLSSEEQFDDQHNQHLTTCQLSTTKLSKNIKTE